MISKQGRAALKISDNERVKLLLHAVTTKVIFLDQFWRRELFFIMAPRKWKYS
jgi:hypothetical protein